jgi:hypothetical protein
MKASTMSIVRSFKVAPDAPHDEVLSYKIACEASLEAALKRYVVCGWRIAPQWGCELQDGMHLYRFRGRPIVQVDDNGDPVVLAGAGDDVLGDTFLTVTCSTLEEKP